MFLRAPAFLREIIPVRWTGELIPPVDGDYRLGASADGGYRIYLDVKKIHR